MVGVDENEYSSVALQWMLEELVDDGDQIICLRVVDRDAKITNDKYVERGDHRKVAEDLLKRIQSMSDVNRAISITLEFSVGKTSDVFGRMVGVPEK